MEMLVEGRCDDIEWQGRTLWQSKRRILLELTDVRDVRDMSTRFVF